MEGGMSRFWQIYNIVKDTFDFNVLYNRSIKYKIFEQNSWEMIYWKLDKNKHQLVGGEQ